MATITGMPGDGAQLFTRGLANAADTRGESMVQKHLARLQAEKERAALNEIKGAFADMPEAVLVVALQEASWDLSQATHLLNAFQTERAGELAQIRKRLLQGKMHVPRGNEDDSSDESQGTDSSSGDSRKRKSRSKPSKDKKSKKKRKKERKEKSRKKAKHEKDEKPKKKETLASTDGFGKYGVIRENDMYSKRSEFSMWATEVQKVDIETLPKFEERELFRTYMEDFNTGTLPHRKYYNLELYERRRAEKAAKRNKPLATEKLVFNDEEELRKAQAAARVAAQEERLRDAYNQLKYTAPGKAEEMREQELMRMHMNLAYRTGDHEKATRIQEKLKPDSEKDPRQFPPPP